MMIRRGKERREAKRISYVCEVQCEGDNVSRLNTRINDLSATGVFIDSMTSYKVGTKLTMKFAVRDVPIVVTGEVRYGMPQVGMGIHFLDLKPYHRKVIENFVDGKPLPSAEEVIEASNNLQEAALLPSTSEIILTGNFALVSLFDVIQIIENSRLTGALVITSPATKGEIHFNEGLIAGGRSATDTGVEAITRFLGATEGTFEFKRVEVEYERQVQATSNMGLLLDLLRIQDEEEAGVII